MSKLPPPPPPPPPPGRSPGGKGTGPRPTPGERPRLPGRPGGLPKWSLWALLAVVALLFFGQNLIPEAQVDKLGREKFLALVKSGKIEEIKFNNATLEITGETTDGVKFSTFATSPGLSENDQAVLDANGVDTNPGTPKSSWVPGVISLFLPIALIIGFFVWMQKRAQGQMGNVMSIGRSRAKAYTTDRPSTTFADVAGYEGVKLEIREVVDFLRMPERFKEIGARVPKGILLVGPPGTGKTLFARAVAGEAGVGFLSVTGSDFMEMFVGVGASRVRDLFQQAPRWAEQSPSSPKSTRSAASAEPGSAAVTMSASRRSIRCSPRWMASRRARAS